MRLLSGATVSACLTVLLGGCGTVDEVRKSVQPEIDAAISDGQSKTMAELLKGTDLPTNYISPVRTEASTNPWGSLQKLENIAWIGGVYEPFKVPFALWIFKEKEPAPITEPSWPRANAIADGRAWCRNLVAQAGVLRGRALAKMAEPERRAAFARAEEIIKEFGPQESPGAETERVMQADMDFVKTAWEKTDWTLMARAAQKLLLLSDPERQRLLAASLKKLKPKATRAPGVEGKVLFEEKTGQGWIIVGGSGSNKYDMQDPVALIVDVGGNDVYSGRVASPSGPGHGVSAVLDYGGDDTYEGENCGLATGRLGCGVIVDCKGNDRYTAKFGGLGVGLAGFGMVVDQAGNDSYRGEQYTIGAAIVGMGYVCDARGDDSYSCDMYGIGLGGPCGIGIVGDLTGNDRYRCGFKEPSGYNASDAPNASPGDPRFQYEGWGIGMGLGRRLYPFDKDKYQRLTLAGGIGVATDASGDDEYESSNFSLGCGYFFGIGVLADFKGNDRYKAARYGIASGAHCAEGLFIDYEGNDTYGSTGPTYNCGCSWDRSVFLFVDAAGHDVYNLQSSAGPGRGDIGSWGLAADLLGDDVYNLSMVPGSNSSNGLSAFFDGAGKDRYSVPGQTISDGRKQKVGEAGLFWDRP